MVMFKFGSTLWVILSTLFSLTMMTYQYYIWLTLRLNNDHPYILDKEYFNLYCKWITQSSKGLSRDPRYQAILLSVLSRTTA